MYFFYDATDEFLFTENETNFQRLYGSENFSPFVKDSFHAYIISGDKSSTNPDLHGTKVAPVYRIKLAAGESRAVYLRLVSLSEWDSNRRRIPEYSTQGKAKPTSSTSSGSVDSMRIEKVSPDRRVRACSGPSSSINTS